MSVAGGSAFDSSQQMSSIAYQYEAHASGSLLSPVSGPSCAPAEGLWGGYTDALLHALQQHRLQAHQTQDVLESVKQVRCTCCVLLGPTSGCLLAQNLIV